MNPAPISCVIVDDEQYAINVLAHFIQETPSLLLLKTFTRSPEALDWLMDNPVDVVFLDVSMPKLSGIDIAQALQGRAKVVLCTAHAEFGAESYNHAVVDYLLKPVEYARFLQAVQKIKESRLYKQPPVTEPLMDFILIPTEGRGRMAKVNFNEISYISANKNYLYIHLRTGLLRTLLSMKEVEQRLPRNLFLRVHNSYIVSINKIKQLDQHAIMLHGHAETIPIGATYRDIVLQQLNRE